jgi:3-deoxy-7-phosphoheptulonate synthase
MTHLPIPETEAETSSPTEQRSSAQPILPASKVRREIALSDAATGTVAKGRHEICDILNGKDKGRMFVVCGPCSIDDVNAASVYAERLQRLAASVEDKLALVMRAYFEKPRSVVGWKGLVYDPLSAEEVSPTAGICIARRLAARVNDLGMPCATEFLNPLVALYLEDCMAYGSIGSRTVESQIHRELASRLEMPMGIKNGMDGSVGSAANAIRSARSRHSFFGQSLDGEPSMVATHGNRHAHLVLRGGSNGPNHDAETVALAVAKGRELGVERPVVVDCSHGNSRKDHTRQGQVCEQVVEQVRSGQDGIAGVMLESNLIEGRQDSGAGGTRRFGQSITDACIGWKDTEYLIRNLARAL